MLKSLIWTPDGFTLDDLDFQFEQLQHESGYAKDNRFMLFKTRGMIEQYIRFFQKRASLQIRNMVELGIWDGGSIALWNEYFQPQKYVALDYVIRGDSEYFKHYKKKRNLDSRIQTYWGVDQANRKRVQEIIHQEFNEPLDLVIDDASHQYLNTKASFETLFPLLRPGGLYIIEDWAWGFWRDPNAPYDPRFVIASHPEHVASPIYTNKMLLSRLVVELLALTGTTWLIEETTIRQGFVVIERNWQQLEDFRIDDFLPASLALLEQPSQDAF